MSQAQKFASSVDQQLSRWLGAIPLLIPILQRLNVVSIINRYCPCQADVDSGTVAFILALNRLMSPRPLYKVADWMAETVLEETLGISAEKLHDRRIGELLDAIHPHLDNIWKEMVHQAFQQFGISLDFIHYDITSLYFEGVYEGADILDYGYSHDDKSDCKQVSLRLNITNEGGIPLAFKVINGSTADRTTPLQNMEGLRQLVEKLPGSEELIIISDQAMLDRDVILYYHQHQIGYLGPLPAKKAYQDVVMSVSTAELLKHPLNYRPKNQKEDEPLLYYGVLSKVEISGKKGEAPVEAQVLLLYSQNKAQLDADKRTTLLNRYLGHLEALKKRLNQRKYKKAAYTSNQIKKAQSQYASVRHLVDVHLTGADGDLCLSYQVNAEQLSQAQEQDGRYLLATNRPLSALEMLAKFKEQDQIEKRIRTVKGPIRVRPMFLHKPQRIEALVFICMLALLVFSLLELLAKRASIFLTADHLCKQFQNLTAVYTHFNDGSWLKQVVPLTSFQTQFILTLDLPAPEIYLKKINPSRSSTDLFGVVT
jgi:transposase